MTGKRARDAWAMKQRRLGKCPRCGTPAAPFYLCEKHRLGQKIHRTLRDMVKTGALVCTPDGRYSAGDGPDPKSYKVSPADRRALPRMGHKYIPVADAAIAILEYTERGMHEEEIYRELCARVAWVKAATLPALQ